MALSEWRERLERFKAQANKFKDKADKAVSTTIEAAEVAGTAAAIGLAEGYTGGDIAMGGIPLELMVAAGGHAYAAFSDTKMAGHFHSIANGGLAVASYKGGKKIGAKAKENKTKTGSVLGEDGQKQLPQGDSRYSIPGETQAGSRAAANVLPGLIAGKTATRPRAARAAPKEKKHHAFRIRDWRRRVRR
jgi:hypothetical protein